MIQDGMNQVPHDLTQLLRRGREGDQVAIDLAIPEIYDELRRLSAKFLGRQGEEQTLRPTALVHEAYLRLVGRSHSEPRDRSHFFRLAATVMRQILIDHARARTARKRHGGYLRVDFNDALLYSDAKSGLLIALDDALKELAEVDRRKAKILELRYFSGMSVDETADALGLSIATIGRETRYAEAWLRRALESEHAPVSP